MSFLNGSTASPAAKLNKPVAAVSAPSPTPSTSSSGGTKRKRPDAPAIVYSQPALTGTGESPYTQAHYVINNMREKQMKVWTFDELIDYLSIPQVDATKEQRNRLRYIFRNHPQIDYNSQGDNGRGTYRYKPKYNIRSADELKAYLQAQKHSIGISVKDLKDGWPDCIPAIEDLERQGQLLVTRNKKDFTPKTVWQDDPSLHQNIERNFHSDWHKIALPPNPDDLRAKLEAAGLKPTSAPKDTKKAVEAKPKKKKVTRRTGKQTNIHMLGILKNYDHKRK